MNQTSNGLIMEEKSPSISARGVIKQRYKQCQSKLYLRWLRQRNQNDFALSPVGLYPFYEDEVSFIYSYHLDLGCGTWFVLNDGSLWNEKGELEDKLNRNGFYR